MMVYLSCPGIQSWYPSSQILFRTDGQSLVIIPVSSIWFQFNRTIALVDRGSTGCLFVYANLINEPYSLFTWFVVRNHEATSAHWPLHWPSTKHNCNHHCRLWPSGSPWSVAKTWEVHKFTVNHNCQHYHELIHDHECQAIANEQLSFSRSVALWLGSPVRVASPPRNKSSRSCESILGGHSDAARWSGIPMVELTGCGRVT